jgi:hypothetical protein
MAKVNAPRKAQDAVAKLVGLQFVAEGGERIRRSRAPYRRKKLALEHVENLANGKPPDSISCE